SYHTGGIRKTDIATGVGLGWTLTGLGSVSRQINGFPDEWRGYGNDVKFDLKVNSNFDVAYLLSILEGKVDAERDCYSYSVPGYSGSFYIVNDQVVQMPVTELVIVPVREGMDARGEISRFEIHTPDGFLYILEDKEYTEFRNFSTQSLPPVIARDYKGVSQWNLTGISSRLSSETVSISYRERQNWMRINDRSTAGYSLGYTVGVGARMGSAGSPSASYDDRTTFSGRSLPEKITTSAGSILFSYWKSTGDQLPSAPADYISGITLMDRDGKTVREVRLDNKAQFKDERRKLTGVTITQGGKITDSYRFTYNDLTSARGFDMFGFPNGKDESQGYSHSILTEELGLNPDRQPSDEFVSDNCLTAIEDITGLKTRIEYEPATIHVTPVYEDGLLSGNITVGVRIRSVTAFDPITQRSRRRSYSYSAALCNIPLEQLTDGDVISQSGSHIYYGGNTPGSYSLGTTFTASATLRGGSPESAGLYYNMVSEEVSGTGLDHPILTEYEYDLAGIHSPVILNGMRPTQDMYAFGNNAEDAKSLASFDNADIPRTRVERYLVRYHPSRGYFSRTFGASPLLIRRTEKEWTPAGYRVNSTEENHYSRTDQFKQVVALYCESMVFRYTPFNGGTPSLNVTSVPDVNYFYNQVETYRTVLDSTVVTRYYP
ncbi:MAG: hypothetical protein K2J07_03785, partial [Muribaculaceae bacterium]|nr:hypothetical protein [Muribaculaceae bacterium]